MHTEYEARFLSVDTEAICDKLCALSATSTMPRTLMRRIVFKNNDLAQRGGWLRLRLRDEGNRVTLTYKQTINETSAIDTTLEAEIQVNDFETTRTLLRRWASKRCATRRTIARNGSSGRF